MIISPRKRFAFDLVPRLRQSQEDRFSNLDQSSPENTALYNSDGVLTFSTGAFAPGVTVDKAIYKMWAIDGGLKYNGLAINGQYFMRWLSDFEADGPMPVTSTFDHGYELSASYFVMSQEAGRCMAAAPRSLDSLATRMSTVAASNGISFRPSVCGSTER